MLARPRFSNKVSPLFLDQIDKLFATTDSVAITTVVRECRDRKDDKFLEMALNGQSDLIVSGDSDSLIMNPFRRIPIITAAAFIAGTIR